MGIPLWKCVTALTVFLVLSLHITNVHSLAVMSVDIGSEWMKVAIVSVSLHNKYMMHNYILTWFNFV